MKSIAEAIKVIADFKNNEPEYMTISDAVDVIATLEACRDIIDEADIWLSQASCCFVNKNKDEWEERIAALLSDAKPAEET